MRCVLLLIGLTVLVASPPALVVGQQSKLTDNEIRAAYCFGYFKEEFDQSKQFVPCQGDEAAIIACRRKAWAGAPMPEDKMKRVLSYLAAKGIVFGNNGAPLAIVQGEQDFRMCFSEMQSPKTLQCYRQSFAPCQSKVPPLKNNPTDADVKNRADAVLACESGQCETQMCQKAAACETMDFLPY